MPTEITKTLNIKTDSYQIEYDQSKKEFLLVVAPHLQVEGVTLGELRIVLDEKIVRQMAEVLPPSEPEFVH